MKNYEYMTKKQRTLTSIIMLIINFTLILISYFADERIIFIVHVVYLPIFLSGLLVGKWFGLTIGLLTGLLLGPLTPSFVDNDIHQNISSQLVRIVMYTLMGTVSGVAKDLFLRFKKIIIDNSHYYSDTNIPKVEYFIDHAKYIDKNKDKLFITILIRDYEKIIKFFYSGFYKKFLTEIYSKLNAIRTEEDVMFSNNIDKFWIVTDNLNYKQVEKRLKDALKNEIVVDNIPLYYSYSFGFSIGKLDLDESINIKTKSDLMAYHAEENKNSSSIYDSSSIEKLDFSILTDFKKSLENNELYLVYQPIISAKETNTYFFEALIRWNHPIKGFITPNEFIPMLEKTNLIHDMTKWIITKNVELIKEYKEKGIDIAISINISVFDLDEGKGVVEHLINSIQIHGIRPSAIELEITESCLLKLSKRVVEIIKTLMLFGVKITIDDFGKGYSSLSYLAALDIDYFKIDKSLIDDLETNVKKRNIVENTINLGHSIGLELVAEGIENNNQYQLLKKLGCDYFQGYYFSRPFSLSEIDQWIKNNPNK